MTFLAFKVLKYLLCAFLKDKLVQTNVMDWVQELLGWTAQPAIQTENLLRKLVPFSVSINSEGDGIQNSL